MTAQISALDPLSVALVRLLNVPAITAPPPTGAGCTGGITDSPIQARPFPYLWYELAERDLSALGRCEDVKTLELRLHVFSTASSFAEGQRILVAAGRILRFAVPAVAGWVAVAIDRPLEIVPLPFEELAGVKVLELVGTWTIYLSEAAA